MQEKDLTNNDMSSWFKRKNKGIQTPTVEKKDVPKGLWYKTPSGKIPIFHVEITTIKQIKKQL